MNFDYLRTKLKGAMMEQSFVEGAATAMAKQKQRDHRDPEAEVGLCKLGQ